jgi:6-phosphogluconolactonase
MARDAWLSHVAIPANQIHDIPAELGNVEGAKAYAKTLAGVRHLIW